MSETGKEVLFVVLTFSALSSLSPLVCSPFDSFLVPFISTSAFFCLFCPHVPSPCYGSAVSFVRPASLSNFRKCDVCKQSVQDESTGPEPRVEGIEAA
eukprot:1258959-Pyramimonas_sp.AAC.1